MHTGYIALLDILGFSSLIASGSGGERVAAYLGCLQQMKRETSVDFVAFSDSIVLTVTGDDPDALLKIMKACSRLMYSLILESIPLRGAISWGEFDKSSVGDSVFVAGNPVIDAYRFEQIQDWVGIMLAPSACSRVPNLDKRCLLPENASQIVNLGTLLAWPAVVQASSVPFKHSNPSNPEYCDHYKGFAIVPTNDSLNPQALADGIMAVIDRLDRLRTLAPAPAVQRKYDRAISWLSGFQVRWAHLASLVRSS